MWQSEVPVAMLSLDGMVLSGRLWDQCQLFLLYRRWHVLPVSAVQAVVTTPNAPNASLDGTLWQSVVPLPAVQTGRHCTQC